MGDQNDPQEVANGSHARLYRLFNCLFSASLIQKIVHPGAPRWQQSTKVVNRRVKCI